MRIAIVGAGALGSAFGAGFVRARHDVSFIDVSEALVATLEESGLTIVDGDQRSCVAVRATTDPATIGPADLVMVFVKAYQTEEAARTLAPLLGPATVLATLQNGLGAAEVLASRNQDARIVCGVTYHAATVLEPGVVRHSVGPTFVGPHGGEDVSGAQLLAGACADAGWPVEATADVAPAVWKKLLMNTSNAVAALTGMNGAAQIAEPHVHALMRDLIAEGIAIAHALGHSALDLDTCIRDVDEVLARAGDGRASMLQDFDAGRRTEVDALNGAVVRAADALGIEVPINRALRSLVKGWERMHGFA